MNLIRWFALLLLWLVPSCGFAAEELDADKLFIQAKLPLPGDFMAFGFDSLWIMSGGALWRTSVTNNSMTRIKLEGTVGPYRGIAIGESAVWVPDVGAGTVYKISPTSNTVLLKIPTSMRGSEGSIGIGEGSVWLTTADDHDKTLVRYNAVSGTQEAAISLPGPGIGVVVAYGSVWVTGYKNGELYRIDPKSNAVRMTIMLHERPRFITSGEESIWVFNQRDGTVQRVHGKSGELLATIETGLAGNGGDITCGGGYVWITMPRTPVVQIDPKTNSVIRAFKRGTMGDAIRYGAGSLWVSGPGLYRIEPPK
jgi:virginiamycin B lyase